MSGGVYQPGRKGPNFSQYIAGLNQIPQESDFVSDDSYNFENDLALFTNTEFIHNDIIDFDLDFDFNQSILGEEEYLKQITTTSSLVSPKVPQEQRPSSPIVTAPAPAATTPLLLPLLPLPSPIAVEAVAAKKTTNNITTTTTTTTTPKKQKLSPRTPKTADSSSSSSSSSTKARLSIQASVANSTSNLSPSSSSSKNPLTITIPPVESATTTAVASSSSQPPTSTLVGNGDMNFEPDFHFTDIGFTPQDTVTGHNIPYGATPTNYEFGVVPQSPFDPRHQLNTPVTTPPNGQQGVRPQGVLPDAAALLEASSRAAAEEDKRRRNTAASARFRYKKKQREQALEKSAKDMTDKLDKLEERIEQLEKENQWLRGLVVERTAKTSEEMAELYKTFKEEDRSKESNKKGVGTLKNEN